MKDDPISPSYYKNMPISPLEYIKANNLDWCIANVVKYVSRYKNKNGIEDLKKAKWYLTHQIQLEEKQTDKPKQKCTSCKDIGEYEVSAGTHSFFTKCECQEK